MGVSDQSNPGIKSSADHLERYSGHASHGNVTASRELVLVLGKNPCLLHPVWVGQGSANGGRQGTCKRSAQHVQLNSQPTAALWVSHQLPPAPSSLQVNQIPADIQRQPWERPQVKNHSPEGKQEEEKGTTWTGERVLSYFPTDSNCQL